MPILERRDSVLPMEYPVCQNYIDAFHNSFWIANKIPFDSDRAAFDHNLTDYEKGLVKRASLAVCNIEVKVKNFWGDLHRHVPKPEVASVGFVFANSEVIHADSYSKLLKTLGMEDAFAEALSVPAIRNRVDYLSKHLAYPGDDPRKAFLYTLALFSATVEGMSLFTAFYVLRSVRKRRNALKGFSTIIDFTACEEHLHFKFGAWLFRTIASEYPDLVAGGFLDDLKASIDRAMIVEADVLGYVFGPEADVPADWEATRQESFTILTRQYNEVLSELGVGRPTPIPAAASAATDWFYESMAKKQSDFFSSKETNYSFGTAVEVSPDDLF